MSNNESTTNGNTSNTTGNSTTDIGRERDGSTRAGQHFKHHRQRFPLQAYLLETNVRQRGNIGGSMIKLGRIAAELERLYGVRNGGHGTNQYTSLKDSAGSANGTSSKSQHDIAEMIGVSIDTIKRAKKIATMPPEWQELVETGEVSVRTAGDIVAKLTPEQQESTDINSEPKNPVFY